MVADNILANFKVDTPHSFLLYVSTLVFVASLFFPITFPGEINIQIKALTIAILSFIAWMYIIVVLSMEETRVKKEEDMTVFNFISVAIYLIYLAVTIAIMVDWI